MTAEVAILNSIGVALASDSAVTLGKDAEKIYTSVDKLFQLHPTDPVAIMIYGNANLLGVPWETIIKTYRQEAPTDGFSTVEDYQESFFKYIQNKPEIFTKRREDRAVELLAKELLLSVRKDLKECIDITAERQDGIDEDTVSEICETVFKERLRIIQNAPDLATSSRRSRTAIRSRYSSSFRELKKDVFGQIPMSKSASMALSKALVEMLSREYFGPSLGGIVIAGFGKKEYFPSLLHVQIEGFLLGKPRVSRSSSVAISDTNAGFVAPFGQQEMVHSFMRGADGELLDHIKSSTKQAFTDSLAAIIEKFEQIDSDALKELESIITPAHSQLLDRLFKSWEATQESFWYPVLQIVSTLPKGELAAMAESLVNLTKFRRQVTRVPETVGGPIDVALITKGDGFVWINRKHYYDRELNPRAMEKYGRQDYGKEKRTT